MSAALITGATGSIGRATLRHWNVAGLTPLPVGRGDVDLLRPGAAQALVERCSPAVVVHLAWCASGTAGYRHAADNDAWLAATRELWAVCRQRRVALVAAGTVLDTSAEPADAYTAAKVALRAACSASIANGEMAWIRPHFVVDPAARRPRLVADVLGGRPVLNPAAAHDFVHVDDVGRAIVEIVRHRRTGPIDIGTGVARTVAELVGALGQAVPGLPDEMPHAGTVADIEPLRRLGWEPTATDQFFARSPSAPEETA